MVGALVLQDVGRSNHGAEKEFVVSREAMLGSMNVHGLEEEAKALLRNREDGTVEVNKWVTEVSYSAFGAFVSACKEGRVDG